MQDNPETKIKESLIELKKLSRMEKNHRLRARLKSLILIKEGQFHRRIDLAAHLGIDYATLKRWLKQYREEGLESLLQLKSGGNRRSAISESIHRGLEEKLNDSKDPLLGYWHAVIWVKDHYGEEVNYQTLRSYMIRHFKSGIKQPRKSHYKKDEEAVEAFKKTA